MSTGVLLINLGTPDSFHPRDVKRYLKEFLTDERVIDIPWLTRQILVRGVLIPRRYRASAKMYEAIWTEEGSPLLVHSKNLHKQLQNTCPLVRVEIAMRYQNPSIEEGLQKLRGAEHLLILPLFPQYASATTGSIFKKVFHILSTWEVIPKVSCVQSYPQNPLMIEAFCNLIQSHHPTTYDHLLFSYHGLPERQIYKVGCKSCFQPQCCHTLTEENKDCYRAQCHATTEAIIGALQLSSSRYSIGFQSRLGKEPWLKPFTKEILRSLPKQGVKKVLVVCPSFVCDCLETLYEIGVEYHQEFLRHGGEKLQLVEGLNTHPKWIEALVQMVQSNISQD